MVKRKLGSPVDESSELVDQEICKSDTTVYNL